MVLSYFRRKRRRLTFCSRVSSGCSNDVYFILQPFLSHQSNLHRSGPYLVCISNFSREAKSTHYNAFGNICQCHYYREASLRTTIGSSTTHQMAVLWSQTTVVKAQSCLHMTYACGFLTGSQLFQAAFPNLNV